MYNIYTPNIRQPTLSKNINVRNIEYTAICVFFDAITNMIIIGLLRILSLKGTRESKNVIRFKFFFYLFVIIQCNRLQMFIEAIHCNERIDLYMYM